jgi:hypothetical protein
MNASETKLSDLSLSMRGIKILDTSAYLKLGKETKTIIGELRNPKFV